ncbi:MAG: hypothetical protein IPL18_13770 [Sphingomonadales bacterium]|nr:hypothetical protein [Sphingomonadales bacterium]
MADNFLQTSFAFDLTPSEGAHLATAVAIIGLIDDADETTALTAWNEASDEFKALFPSPEDEPLSGLLDLFSDPDFPQFGATIEIGNTTDGKCRVHIYGDQFDPDATASLLAAIVSTSFPIICTWAATCSKLRLEEFTGGGFRLDRTGLHSISARHLDDNTRLERRHVRRRKKTKMNPNSGPAKTPSANFAKREPLQPPNAPNSNPRSNL